MILDATRIAHLRSLPMDQWAEDEEYARYAAALRTVLGMQGTDEEILTEFQKLHFWQYIADMEAYGRQLADMIDVYGLAALPPLTDADRTALRLVIPYARALRVRAEVEAAHVIRGGVGTPDYYATYTNGDKKIALRLQAEAITKQSMYT